MLSALSVAIGVAVFLAIQLANASARQAFSSAIDLVAGKAQLEISAPAGDLPDEILPRVQQTPSVEAATPLVRGLVALSDSPGEYLDILGLDVFTNEPFRTFELGDSEGLTFDVAKWLGQPKAVALSSDFARRHGLRQGDNVRVQVNGREENLTVAFVLKGAALAGAGDHFAAMDIGWAQEFLGRRGFLNSIQVRLAPKADRDALEKNLRARLPANVEVAAPSRRSRQIDQMLAGFQLNLTAMSMVSLLVGAFLIYNAIAASVVRRRREIGILRSLGTSAPQIRAIFLGQALVAALIGTMLGLGFGNLLARELLAAVSGTVSSLYTLVDVQHVALNLRSYLVASVLGLGSALMAAWFPAASAARLPPVQALIPGVAPERDDATPRRNLAYAILAEILAVLACLGALQSGPAWLSFLAAFFALAGASLLAPSFISLLARGCRCFPKHLLALQLAAQNFRRSLARNSVTVAALACAVAMASAVSVMIFSFRETVTAWISQTLVADLFVTPASNEITGPTAFLPEEALHFFEKRNDVAAVDTFRQIELPFREKRLAFAGIRADGPRFFPFVSGDPAKLMEKFRHDRCVIVSESFARRFHFARGDMLPLPTPHGSISLPIAGIFYDYTRDQGVVFTNSVTFVELFGDRRINSVGIYLRKEADADEVTKEFRAQFSRRGEYALYSNSALRQRAFEIFEQTFAVTYVLRAIAVIVAVIGIFLSFTTLTFERARLFAIMRSLGLTRSQLRRTVVAEAVLVALASSALGLLAGAALAEILTGVVNRAFFGWTIRLRWPWGTLALTPVWLLLAAIVAALIPAFRAARHSLAENLQAE